MRLEEAKRNAVVDLEQEENGNSLPRRVFNALLNRPSSKNSDSSTMGEVVSCPRGRDTSASSHKWEA